MPMHLFRRVPAPPPRATVVNVLLAVTAAAGTSSLFLSLAVLLSPLIHLRAGNPALGMPAVAACYAVGRLTSPLAPPPVEPLGPGAGALVAASGASLVGLVAGGFLVPTTPSADASTLIASYAAALFLAFTVGVLLLVLSADRPIIPAAEISRSAAAVVELSAEILVAVNFLFSLTSVLPA